MDHVNVTGDITEATVNTLLGGACLTGILRMRELKTKLWKLKTNKGITKEPSTIVSPYRESQYSMNVGLKRNHSIPKIAITFNTFSESLKHSDQTLVGFVSGT